MFSHSYFYTGFAKETAMPVVVIGRSWMTKIAMGSFFAGLGSSGNSPINRFSGALCPRGAYDLRIGKSSRCPAYNNAHANPDIIRKIGGTVGNPLYRYRQSVGAVPSLLTSSRPSAILGRVVSIVVDTINGITNRLFTHIFGERLKIMQPPITDANTASTVVRIFFGLDVIAPLLHSRPSSIKWMTLFEGHCNTPEYVMFNYTTMKGETGCPAT